MTFSGYIQDWMIGDDRRSELESKWLKQPHDSDKRYDSLWGQKEKDNPEMAKPIPQRMHFFS